MAAGDESGQVRLWKLEGQRWSHRGNWFPVPDAPVAALAFKERLWALAGGRLTTTDRPGLEVGEEVFLLAHRGSRLLLAGEARALLYAWDGGWQPLRELRVTAPAREVDVCEDGSTFLVVRDRASVDIYTAEGQLLSTWERPGCAELSARFGPTDARDVYLAARGAFDLICVSARTGRQRARLSGSGWLGPLAASPDGSRLAARERGQEVRVYDLVEERELFYHQPLPDRSQAHAQAGMTRIPATVEGVPSERARVTRWSLATPGEGRHTALALDSERVAAGTREGTVWVAELNSTALVRLEGETARIMAEPCCQIVLSTTPRAVGVQDGVLLWLGLKGELWEVSAATGRARKRSRKFALGPVDREAQKHAHLRGRLLLQGSSLLLFELARLRSFEVASGRLQRERPGLGLHPVRLADGSLRAYDFVEGEPRLFRLDPNTLEAEEARKLPARMVTHPGPAWAGGTALVLQVGDAREALHPAGERSLHFYDVASGGCTRLSSRPGEVIPSMDGRHFALLHEGGGCTVWRGSQPLRRISPDRSGLAPGTPAVVLPDQDLACFGETSTNRIGCFDLQGRLLGELVGHGAPLWGLLPSPDGKHLLSWDRAGVVRWWDLPSREGSRGQA